MTSRFFLPDSCQAETKSFLACKEEWKAEIEGKLEKLKTIERELSNKEKQLLEVGNYSRYMCTILVCEGDTWPVYANHRQFSRLGTCISYTAFWTRFSRLEVPEQALDGVPLGLRFVTKIFLLFSERTPVEGEREKIGNTVEKEWGKHSVQLYMTVHTCMLYTVDSSLWR